MIPGDAAPVPELRLEGCRGRPFVEEDAPLLAATVRDSREEIGRWMSWVHPDYGVEDALAFIRRSTAQRARGEAWDFGLFGADAGLLGSVGINRIDAENRTGNIGYWVATRHHQQGLATRAVRAVSVFGFERLGLARIEIVAAEDNLPSRRVAEKVGAAYECLARRRVVVDGCSTTAAVYSLVPEDLAEIPAS